MSDGIFAGMPPRHVENANARLEIRRDESQGRGKRKSDEQAGAHDMPEWDDTAYVSLASLRTFLESVVPHDDPEIYIPPVHEASTTLHQRATSAYQNAGRAGHDENVASPAPSASHIETNFTEEDMARIRGFISDLIELDRRGISELAMQRSASFLDSIEAAIASALAA